MASKWQTEESRDVSCQHCWACRVPRLVHVRGAISTAVRAVRGSCTFETACYILVPLLLQQMAAWSALRAQQMAALLVMQMSRLCICEVRDRL